MVIETEKFRQSLEPLPEHIRRIAAQKIELLSENRAHPNLRVHRMDNLAPDTWSCAVARKYRLLYQLQDSDIHLLQVLSHETYNRI